MTRRFMQDNRDRILRDCAFCESDLERKVFDLLCRGYSEEEIAGEVYLSKRTVVRRVASIRAKIEAAAKSWR